jgi:hypothetical protein
MLTILGRPDGLKRRGTHCDGLTRRGFLKIGGMAAGGLSLPQLLAMEAQAGAAGGRSHKAIINVFLPGGPSHIDFFDLKPDAPSEVRGEFSPIRTNVPGMQINELFPRLAKCADKYAIIRSVVGSEGQHSGYQCMTGRRSNEQAPPGGGWPAGSAWVSKLLDPVNQAVPPNLSLMYPTGERRWGQSGDGGFLGAAHQPVQLVSRKIGEKPEGLALQGVTLERLRDRKRLANSLDKFRREIDTTGVAEGLDAFGQQAMGILTSSALADALDLSKEDPAVLERYGQDDPKFQRDGAPKIVSNFLVARRLVEAGARIVSMNYSRWDWHGGDGMNFPRSREEFPLFDQGLSALIEDLHARGLDRDVTVVVWGEFGRTPRINKNNSRDHWPQVSFALLAGGGMRTGQVIGSTNRLGEHAADRPVSFQEVWATLYHNVGIDVANTRVFDVAGRPQYLVDPGVEAIRELI